MSIILKTKTPTEEGWGPNTTMAFPIYSERLALLAVESIVGRMSDGSEGIRAADQKDASSDEDVPSRRVAAVMLFGDDEADG